MVGLGCHFSGLVGDGQRTSHAIVGVSRRGDPLSRRGRVRDRREAATLVIGIAGCVVVGILDAGFSIVRVIPVVGDVGEGILNAGQPACGVIGVGVCIIEFIFDRLLPPLGLLAA